MPKEHEIKITVSSINAAMKKQNVYASCEDGGIHLVTGNVTREKDGLYADTVWGRQKVKSAKVIDK